MRALENTLTPEKICNDFFNGSMSKNEAEELLISLVETSENMNIRIGCIDAFEQIRIKNERVFKILEICLISDENPLIRAAAAKSFLLLFPKKGFRPLKWSIQNEKSAFVIIPLFDLLEILDNFELEIYSKEIIKRFECVCFHMADVPYGRGGSPLQNLIARGHRETKLTALRMVEDFDAGPVYSKMPLCLYHELREFCVSK